MLVIGHRGSGVSKNGNPYRENTIRSLHAALAAGADGVEFDVRISRDGVLFLHHDPEIGERSLSSMNYQEITALLPEAPTFEEVLDTISERYLLDVEIKDPRAATLAVQMIGRRKQVVLSSFLPEALSLAKQAEPRLRTALIVGGYPADLLKQKALAPWGRMDWADFLIAEQHILPLLAPRAQNRGYEVWSWNSNGQDDWKWVEKLGGGAVITDTVTG